MDECNFIWKIKMHYIKKPVRLNNYNHDGLNFIDLISFYATKFRLTLPSTIDPPLFRALSPMFSHLDDLNLVLLCSDNININPKYSGLTTFIEMIYGLGSNFLLLIKQQKMQQILEVIL